MVQPNKMDAAISILIMIIISKNQAVELYTTLIVAALDKNNIIIMFTIVIIGANNAT